MYKNNPTVFKRPFIIVMVAIVALILSACGGEDKAEISGSSNSPTDSNESSNSDTSTSSDSSTENVSFSADSIFADIRVPSTNDLMLPAVPELEGSLIFSRGGSLYHGAFDGEAAQFLVADISAATVDLSPNGEYVAYTSPGVRRLKMLFQDLESTEITELVPISGSFRQIAGHITGWSPDQQWVIVNDTIGPKQTVVSVDGATSYELGDSVYPMWLSDNRVLLVDVDLPLIQAAQNFEPQVVEDFSVYDPSTEELTALDIPTDAVQSPLDYNGIVVALESEGLTLADTPDLFGYTVFDSDDASRYTVQLPQTTQSFTPEHCNVWTIDKLSEDGTVETAYSAEDVLWITDLTLLVDRSILFLQWSAPDCSPDDMEIALMRMMPDGETVQVVNGISRIEEGRNNLNVLPFNQGHRYAISPDGQYVVYPTGNNETMSAKLNLTDINTGETITLLEAASASSANAFMDNDMFRSVFWVAD